MPLFVWVGEVGDKGRGHGCAVQGRQAGGGQAAAVAASREVVACDWLGQLVAWLCCLPPRRQRSSGTRTWPAAESSSSSGVYASPSIRTCARRGRQLR